MPRERWRNVFGVDYEIPTTRIEDIQVPDVATLVRSKAKVGRPKDSVGLLKSYLIAFQTDEALVTNSVWREVLPDVLETIGSHPGLCRSQGSLPWLSTLIEKQFQVPELADLVWNR